MGELDRRRRILVNGDEVRTERALREAVASVGYRLDAKVRVADALNIDHSGLSSAAYGYALRSHFDWVISDLGTTIPEFAVEFDGPSHDRQDVRTRDALKGRNLPAPQLPLASHRRPNAESNGASAAYAWAYLPDESLVLGHARVRASFFPAFPDYDLADDLSLLDLADRLQRYLEGDQSVTVTQDYVAARVLRQLVERHGPIRPSDLPDWSFGFSG